MTNSGSERVSGRVRDVPCPAMRAWVNGSASRRPDAPAIPVTRPRVHRRRRGLRGGQGRRRPTVRAHPPPERGSSHSARGLGLPEPDLDEVRRGVAEVLAEEHLAARPAADHLHRRAGAAGLGPRGRRRRRWSSWRRRSPARGRACAVVTVPWPRNERGAVAGLKTTSYAENVVALAHAAERGASEAIFANLAGNLCEGTGSNVFYVVDGELRTPTLASGCLAGHHQGAAAGVVRRAGGRRADGGAGGRRRGLPGLDDAGRPAGAPVRRPGPGGAGTGHHRGRRRVARAGGARTSTPEGRGRGQAASAAKIAEIVASTST